MRRLVAALGQLWVPVAALVLLAVWSATLVVAPRLQGAWSSTAIVSFIPRDPIGTGADTLVLLGPRYTALLDNSTMLRAVGDQLGETERSMREGTRVSIQPGTLNLEISFSSSDGPRAARAANALAGVLVEKVSDDALVYAQQVARGQSQTRASSPSLNQLLVVGGLGGVLAAALLGASVYHRTSRRA